ncbi:hypothetical protein CBR_g57608 [Chara braunii]|uniref:Right handed beta helix domain-containing protein n=1 Tax=Chara braunii TaxID=69332 RepID=A0A388ME96_CHABU|nr:hypothetical protein CBR_g57608 [Chara braunii]|eukprot:GBG92881.1 hypothetical protein CBR_g57608 [Chara braunii]
MAGEHRTSRRRTACAPLVALLLLVLVSSGGHGGGGVKASERVAAAAATRRALAAARPTTPEARLRAAVTSRNATVLRLTSDILLTSDLPLMTCPNLTVVGNCRTRDGRWRSCKIDGGKKFFGFRSLSQSLDFHITIRLDTGFHSGSTPRLELVNLHLTNFHQPIVEILGFVVVRNCLVTKNTVTGFSFSAYELRFERSTFTSNNGSLIGGMYVNVHLKGAVFRSNIGGPAITFYQGGVYGERCRFEANSGGAVGVTHGGVRFIRSSFVNNSGGAVSIAYDASGIFCHCEFAGNSDTLSEGRSIVRHVYFGGVVSWSAGVQFCKQRPRVGVVLEKPDLASYIKDSCKECPK